MIIEVAEHLPLGGVFALYGPFNYNGVFTSDSNQRFDEFLKNKQHIWAFGISPQSTLWP